MSITAIEWLDAYSAIYSSKLVAKLFYLAVNL